MTHPHDIAQRPWTGGEWRTDNFDVFAGAKKVCILTNNSNDGRLIAAAPELFEALDEAVNYLAVWAAEQKDKKAAALLDKCTAALTRANPNAGVTILQSLGRAARSGATP